MKKIQSILKSDTFKFCVLVLIIGGSILSLVNISQQQQSQKQVERKAALIAKQNDEVERLLHKEKTSYVSVTEGEIAYTKFRNNQEFNKHMWRFVDPKTGGEYYFRNGTLTPRLKTGKVQALVTNTNWEKEHHKKQN